MNKIVKALFGLSVSALLASCGCSPTQMSVSSSPSSEQGGGTSSSSSDSTGTSSDSSQSISSDTSQSSYQPGVYTLTFDSKGGSAVITQAIEAGGKFTRPTDPTKEGYDFAGWYKEDTYQNAFDFNAEVTANVTVYAKWTAKATPAVQYTITFDSKGGSAVAVQTIEAGEKFSIPDDPTKEGYDFAGWYKEEAYENEFDFNAEVTASVTVYAKWTAKAAPAVQYTLTFVTGEGASTVAVQTINEGEKFVKPTDPTKEGYDFAGWYKEEAYENEFDFNAEVTANATAYAKWEEEAEPVYSYGVVLVGSQSDPVPLIKYEEDVPLVDLDAAFLVKEPIEFAKDQPFFIQIYADEQEDGKIGSGVSILVGKELVSVDQENGNLLINKEGNYAIVLYRYTDGTYAICIYEMLDKMSYQIGEQTGSMVLNSVDAEHSNYVAEAIEASAGDEVSFTLNGAPFEYKEVGSNYIANGKIVSNGVYTFVLEKDGSLTVYKEPVYEAKAGETILGFEKETYGDEVYLIISEQNLTSGTAITFTKDGQALDYTIEKDSEGYFNGNELTQSGIYTFRLNLSAETPILEADYTPISGSTFTFKVGEGEAQKMEMEIRLKEEYWKAEGVKLAKADVLTFYKDGQAYTFDFATLDGGLTAYYLDNGAIKYSGTYDIEIEIGETKGTATLVRTDKVAENAIVFIDEQVRPVQESEIIDEHDEKYLVAYALELKKGDAVNIDFGNSGTILRIDDGEEVSYIGNILNIPYNGTYKFFINKDAETIDVVFPETQEPVYYASVDGKPITLNKGQSQDEKEEWKAENIDLRDFGTIEIMLDGKPIQYIVGTPSLQNEDYAVPHWGYYNLYYRPAENILYLAADVDSYDYNEGYYLSGSFGGKEAWYGAPNYFQNEELNLQLFPAEEGDNIAYIGGVYLKAGDVLQVIGRSNSVDVWVWYPAGETQEQDDNHNAKVSSDGYYNIYLTKEGKVFIGEGKEQHEVIFVDGYFQQNTERRRVEEGTVIKYEDFMKAPEGYEYAWFTTEDYEKGTEVTGDIKVGHETLILYGNPKVIEYSISIDLDGGSFGQYKAPTSYTFFEDDIEFPTPVKDGYTFLHWVNEKEEVVPGSIPGNSSGDRVFKAIYSQAKVCSFDSNGGSFVDPIEAENNLFAKPTDPTKTGYDFVGWYSDKELKNAYNWQSEAVTRTLYAKWELHNFQITYENLTEEEKQSFPSTFTIEGLKLPLELDDRSENVHFGGLFTKDKEGVYHQVTRLEEGTASDLTLYARWISHNNLYLRGTAVTEYWDSPLTPALNLYQSNLSDDIGFTVRYVKDLGYLGSVRLGEGDFRICDAEWQNNYNWDNFVLGNADKDGNIKYFELGEGNDKNIHCKQAGYYSFFINKDKKLYIFLDHTIDSYIDYVGIRYGTHGENDWADKEIYFEGAEENWFKYSGWIDLKANQELGIQIGRSNVLAKEWHASEAEVEKYPDDLITFVNNNIKVSETGRYYFKVYINENNVKLEITDGRYTLAFFDLHGTKLGEITAWYGTQINAEDITAAGIINPEEVGYISRGWTEENGNKPINFPYTIAFNRNIYAIYDPIQYTVTYDANGGSGSIEQLKFTYDGEDHALSDGTGISFTGYTFAGWSLTQDGELIENSVKLFENATVTLYAQWTPNTYYVAFNGGEGVTGEMANQEFTYGQAATLNAVAFEKENYHFAGWATSLNGEVVYADKAEVSNLTAVNNDTYNLYAVWTQKTVLTYYDAKGGNALGTKEAYPEAHFEALADPTKTGYTFTGWKNASDDSAFDFATYVATNEPVAVYATWTVHNYQVKFNANGGTGEMANEAYAYDESKALTANAFTKAGYDFAGWALAADGDVVHTDAKVVSNLASEDGATFNLYAKWTVHEYTITYNLDGGTNAQANPAVYSIEGQDIALADATKDGYTFLGWFDAAQEGNKITAIAHDHQANVTLYAHWEETVVYKVVGKFCDWSYEDSTVVLELDQSGYGKIEILIGIDDTSFKVVAKGVETDRWYNFDGYDPAGGNAWVDHKNVKYIIEFDTKGHLGNEGNKYINITEWAPEIAQITGKIGEADMDFSECADPNYAAQVKATVSAHANDVLTFKYKGDSIAVIVEDVDGNKAVLDGNDIKIIEDGEMNVYFKAYKNGTYGVYVAPNFGVGIYVRGDAAHGGVPEQGWAEADCVAAVALKEPTDAEHNIGQLLNIALSVGDFKLAYLNWNEGTWSWTKQNEESRVIGGAGSDSNYFEKGQKDDNIHCKVAGLYNIYLTKNGYISIEKVMYSMTFNSNDGSEVDPIQVHAGTGTKFVAPSAPEKAGYTFGGWYTDQGCTKAYDWQATPSDSLTVYAKWTVIDYDITYTGGGVADPANPVKYNVETATFELINPTREGYIFTGWSGTGLQGSNNKSVTITVGSTGDRAYEAHWDANNYIINYELDGGKVATPNPTSYTIETPTFTLVNPTKDGYAFEGWKLNNQGDLMPTVTISQGSIGNKSYTAYWTNAYSVTYNGNGSTSGEAPAGEAGIANNVKHTVAGNTGNLAKTGYTFNGWNTLANGAGTAYAAGDEVAFNQNTILYAQWQANSYTVTFDVISGESVDPSSKSVTYDAAYGALPTPTKDGYKFAGWFTARDGGTQVTAETAVAIEADQTLYPHWNKISTVTLTVNGGTINEGDVSSYVESEGAVLPTNVTRAHYTFAGWYDNEQLAGDPVTEIAAQATGNLTFWAKWTGYQVTVTYNSNGGSGSMANSVHTYGAQNYATLSANSFIKDGYVFVGWNDAADGSGASYAALGDDDFENASNSLTLYAIWSLPKDTGVNLKAYYIVGNMTDWDTAVTGYGFTIMGEQKDGKDQYESGILTLKKDDHLKVRAGDISTDEKWYGGNEDYVVPADGEYRIYLVPAGGISDDGWTSNGGYFYVAWADTRTGVYLTGKFNNVDNWYGAPFVAYDSNVHKAFVEAENDENNAYKLLNVSLHEGDLLKAVSRVSSSSGWDWIGNGDSNVEIPSDGSYDLYITNAGKLVAVNHGDPAPVPEPVPELTTYTISNSPKWVGTGAKIFANVWGGDSGYVECEVEVSGETTTISFTTDKSFTGFQLVRCHSDTNIDAIDWNTPDDVAGRVYNKTDDISVSGVNYENVTWRSRNYETDHWGNWY